MSSVNSAVLIPSNHIVNSPIYNGEITDDMRFLAFEVMTFYQGIPSFDTFGSQNYFFGSFKNLASELERLDLQFYIFAIFKTQEELEECLINMEKMEKMDDDEEESLQYMDSELIKSFRGPCYPASCIDDIMCCNPNTILKMVVTNEERQFGYYGRDRLNEDDKNVSLSKFKEVASVMNKYQQNFPSMEQAMAEHGDSAELNQIDFKILISLSLTNNTDVKGILLKHHHEIRPEWFKEFDLSLDYWETWDKDEALDKDEKHLPWSAIFEKFLK